MSVMKRRSSKIKKAKLPLEKMTEREKGYVGAVLEEMRANFSAFGEALGFVRERGEATFEEVGRIRVEMEEIKGTQVLIQEDIKILRNDVRRIDGRLDNIEREVSSIKSEINALKTILTQKADLDFLKKLEERLIIIERHLKLSNA